MKAIKFITENDLITFFENFVASAFLQVVTLTNPKTNKKSRVTNLPTPFAILQHVKNFNARIGYNYEDNVNAQAEREGLNPEFVAQEHKWAEHVKGTVFCRKRDKGGRYVAYVQQRVDDSEYFADGDKVNIADLSEYMPPKSDYKNQPTKKKVPVQLVKVENILSFVHGETTYYVVR
jgi:hypothetical protein